MDEVSGPPGLRVEGFGTSFLIALPVRGLIPSQLMQISPGEQAGVVTVVEDDLDGVLADGFHCADADSLFAEDQHFLAGAMPLYFSGG